MKKIKETVIGLGIFGGIALFIYLLNLLPFWTGVGVGILLLFVGLFIIDLSDL